MSASTTAASATPAKWWPFATICVPSSTARSAAAKRRSASGTAPRSSTTSASSRIRSSSGTLLGELPLEALVPAPMRASSDDPQTGQTSGEGSTCAQWWQCSRSSRCSTSATSQFGQRRVLPQARQCSAGATPRRLSSRIAFDPSSATRPSAASSGADSG